MVIAIFYANAILTYALVLVGMILSSLVSFRGEFVRREVKIEGCFFRME